eukprot:m.54053 g.54053  ORF g.54053 m.54053 type:complete len:269 (+) comp13217_c0_seq1:77-883(+)
MSLVAYGSDDSSGEEHEGGLVSYGAVDDDERPARSRTPQAASKLESDDKKVEAVPITVSEEEPLPLLPPSASQPEESNGTTSTGTNGDGSVPAWRPVLPTGQPAKDVCERVAKFTEKRTAYIALVNSNKAFRNPSIHETLLKKCNIDQQGSNIKTDHFVWGPDDFFDKLAEAYSEAEKRLAKKRTEIHFVSSGGGIPPPRPGSNVGAAALAAQARAAQIAASFRPPPGHPAAAAAVTQSQAPLLSAAPAATGGAGAPAGDRKRKSKWD